MYLKTKSNKKPKSIKKQNFLEDPEILNIFDILQKWNISGISKYHRYFRNLFKLSNVTRLYHKIWACGLVAMTAPLQGGENQKVLNLSRYALKGVDPRFETRNATFLMSYLRDSPGRPTIFLLLFTKKANLKKAKYSLFT